MVLDFNLCGKFCKDRSNCLFFFVKSCTKIPKVYTLQHNCSQAVGPGGHPIIISKLPLDIPNRCFLILLVDFESLGVLSPARKFSPLHIFWWFCPLWCHLLIVYPTMMSSFLVGFAHCVIIILVVILYYAKESFSTVTRYVQILVGFWVSGGCEIFPQKHSKKDNSLVLGRTAVGQNNKCSRNS